MNAQYPSKWWSTHKSAVFGSSSSLPPLVVGVVDRCASLLVLFCCQIILTAIIPGSLLISRSHAIRLLVLTPLPSGRVRLAVSCWTRTLMIALTHKYLMFPRFLKRSADILAPPSQCNVSLLLNVSLFDGERLMSLQFRKVHRPLRQPNTE